MCYNYQYKLGMKYNVIMGVDYDYIFALFCGDYVTCGGAWIL